ncbi:MAG: hypothetical protein AAFQ05_01720 [Pseudomonadota bacterium]
MKPYTALVIANDFTSQLQVPAETESALAMKAVDTVTAMRLLVLATLKDAGVPVVVEALFDRRKPKT